MIDLQEGLRLARGFYSTGRGDPVAPDISAAYTAWLDNNVEPMIQELLSLREEVERLRNELARYTHQTCHYDAEGNVVCSEDVFP